MGLWQNFFDADFINLTITPEGGSPQSVQISTAMLSGSVKYSDGKGTKMFFSESGDPTSMATKDPEFIEFTMETWPQKLPNEHLNASRVAIQKLKQYTQNRYHCACTLTHFLSPMAAYPHDVATANEQDLTNTPIVWTDAVIEINADPIDQPDNYGMNAKTSTLVRIYKSCAYSLPVAVPQSGLQILSGSCNSVVIIASGQEADGTPLSAASPVILQYSFGGYYTARIAPGSDPSIPGSWTYVSGSRNQAQFENEIVAATTSSADALNWSFSPHLMAAAVGQVGIQLGLVIDQSGALSAMSQQPANIQYPGHKFSFEVDQPLGSVLCQFSTKLVASSTFVVDWGDGTVETFTQGTALTSRLHIYATNGNYLVEVYACESFEEIRVDPFMSVSKLYVGSQPDLLVLVAHSNSIDNTIDLNSCTSLQDVQLYTNQIPAITLDQCTALTNINLATNQIGNAQDLTAITGLTFVSYSSNQLAGAYGTVFNVSGLASLTEIYVSNNQLTGTADLLTNPALTTFVCNVNQLVSTIHAGHPALQYYEVQNNQLANVHDFTGVASIVSISIRGNQVPELNIVGLTNLAQVFASNNQLAQAFNLTTNTALLNFDVADNLITSMIFGTLPLLNYLAFNDNLVGNEIDLRNCAALVTAWGYNNQCTKLFADGLANLQDVRFYNNLIDNAQDFSASTVIRFLQLHINAVPSVDISANPQLANVLLDNNQVANLDDVVDWIWTNRAVVSGSKVLRINVNPPGYPLSATAVDQITGAGAYASDGLVDNGWTVTY